MLNGHSDLLEMSILAKYSLAISTTVALFICLMCGVGQTLTSIWEHLDTKHTKLGMTALDKNHLKDIIEQGEISPSYPEIESSIMPCAPISGLAIHDSVGCPHCAYAAVKKVVVKHMKMEHPGQ